MQKARRSRRENSARRTAIDPGTWVIETHHRIKNHLQLIAALLAHQARNEPAVTAVALRDAQYRILAVARLHEMLQVSDADACVQVATLIGRLCDDFTLGFGLDARGLSLAIDTEPMELPSETAVTLALVVNELVTNSIKHAYAESGGEIRIRLRTEFPGWRLTVADDGPGLAGARHAYDLGTGGDLIQALVAKLRGALVVDEVDHGASISVFFA